MLSPEQIKEIRARHGIQDPNANNAPAVSTSDRASELDAAWGDTPEPKEEPKQPFGKVGEAMQDVSKGVAKGVLSTVKGMGKLGEKIGNALLPEDLESRVYSDEDALAKSKVGKILTDENLEGKNTAEKVGKTVEQIAEFFIPAGKINTVEKILAGGTKSRALAKLIPIVGEKSAKHISNLLSAGTKMAVRAGEGGGIIAVQSGGDPEQVKSGVETGAGFSAVTSALSPVLRKVLAPFKGSFDDVTHNYFQSEGIKAPLSATTKNKGVQNIEAIASKTLFGKGINETATKAVGELENKTNQVIESITPKKAMSDQDLGKMLKTGLNEFETHFKETEDKVYEAFSKKYGMSPIKPTGTQAELASILSQQGQDIYKGVDPNLKRMFQKMGEESPVMKKIREGMLKEGLPEETIAKEMEKMIAEQPPFQMRFSELKATRTSVGEALAKDPENTALKRLYGSLSRDMENAVSFDEEGKTALEKINAKYKAGKDKIESRIAQSMIQSNPEKIADNLITKNSADTINTLKEMVGPERFKEVSKYFVSNMVNKATTEGGKFKVEKLKAALAEFDQQTLDAMLTPVEQKGLNEGIQHLEKLNSMTEAVKAGSKAASGSQTAFLANAAGSATALATGIQTALATGNYTILLALGAKTAGEYGLAKFIASDIGRKIMTEGINPDNIKLIQKLKPALRSTIIEMMRPAKNKEEDPENWLDD